LIDKKLVLALFLVLAFDHHCLNYDYEDDDENEDESHEAPPSINYQLPQLSTNYSPDYRLLNAE
jgi:hypothetical protein